jgi:hypothetical protein
MAPDCRAKIDILDDQNLRAALSEPPRFASLPRRSVRLGVSKKPLNNFFSSFALSSGTIDIWHSVERTAPDLVVSGRSDKNNPLRLELRKRFNRIRDHLYQEIVDFSPASRRPSESDHTLVHVDERQHNRIDFESTRRIKKARDARNVVGIEVRQDHDIKPLPFKHLQETLDFALERILPD